MTPPWDSRSLHQTERYIAIAARVLLASLGWAQQVNAADPRSGGSAASGPVTALVIDLDTPTTLYAGIGYCGIFKRLDGAVRVEGCEVFAGFLATVVESAPTTNQ